MLVFPHELVGCEATRSSAAASCFVVARDFHASLEIIAQSILNQQGEGHGKTWIRMSKACLCPIVTRLFK